jgi:hypothetical protein
MDNDKTEWSNVIIGPWVDSSDTNNVTPISSKNKKTRDQLIAEEMEIIDSLSEKLMIQLIQSLKDNEVNITTTDFIRDIGFLNEALKSLLFREMGYEHPLSDLVKYIIVASKTKDKKDIYTKFRGDIIVELLEYLESVDEE